MFCRVDTPGQQRQRGSISVTFAVLLVGLVGFAALSIDVGYILATRSELQNVADGAALAAARQMGNNYQNMNHEEQLGYDCSSNGTFPCEQTIAVAQEVGLANQAAQTNITISDVDVEIGSWKVGGAPPFVPTTAHPNAVRVTARRDQNENNPITMFLAGVVGVGSINVSAQATAALTGQSTALEGELELPVGISDVWFTGGFCGQPIRFSPANSPDSCAGWTSWEYNANDNTIRNILDLDDPLLNPELGIGDFVNFTGGTLSNPTFDALETLFQHRGYDIQTNGGAVSEDSTTGEPIPGTLDHPDAVAICESIAGDTENYYPCDETHTVPLLYPDGTPRNDHVWLTKVAVYNRDDCSNPNQSVDLLGFAEVKVTEVLNAPDKSIVAEVECEKNDKGLSRGGGGSYGTYGSIPGLVQ